jgi:hypothetical protein
LLSAPKVIEEVNSCFIPALVNVSTDGYPGNLVGMKRVPDYVTNGRDRRALAAVEVFSPGGAHLLGTTRNTVLDKTAELSMHAPPEKLLAFMRKCLKRQQAVPLAQEDGGKGPPKKAEVPAEPGDPMKKENDEAERRAASKLQFAEQYAQFDKAKSIQKLEDLVAGCPNTKAAAQARQLLAQWKK